MRKIKIKSKYLKPDELYKRRVWVSGFLLLVLTAQLMFFLLYYLIPLIFLNILLLGLAILEFYNDYIKLKKVRNSPNLKKKALKFEKDLNMQHIKIIKNMKIIEEKVKEVNNLYFLFEENEVLRIKFENQKEKHQFQNYKIKLDNLKDSLHEIKKNYDESIKSELKILWATKPRNLKRRIKRVAKDIDHINTQCNLIELKLKEDFEIIKL